MIHTALILLLLLIAVPLTLFFIAFLIAIADFLYAQLFPSCVPELLDDIY